jgi:lipoprotein signal peptidase
VIPLGPFGSSIREFACVAGTNSGPRDLTVWLIAATLVAAAGGILPANGVGGCSGGSFSHAFESTVRGAVSDYICLRFWPAFNLADVAIVAGGIGVIVTLAAYFAGAR